jgi:hypothetical protein
MRTILAAAAGIALLSGLTACGGASTLTAHGTETVAVSVLDGESAREAFPDVTDGSQVTVMDSTRNIIGNGILSETSTSIAEEQFRFTVTVPGGLARYGIQVGSNRGTLWFSNKQMRQGPGLCLGDGCPQS